MATVMDVLVKSVIPFPDLRRDATIINVGPLKVPVASIEHLIAMKTCRGRSKDVIDIVELRKIQVLHPPGNGLFCMNKNRDKTVISRQLSEAPH